MAVSFRRTESVYLIRRGAWPILDCGGTKLLSRGASLMRHLGILAALFIAHTAFAAPAADVQARIFNYFLDRAEKGDASAQFIVGFRYESGSGTERDMKKAMDWYAKAATQGHEQARER